MFIFSDSSTEGQDLNLALSLGFDFSFSMIGAMCGGIQNIVDDSKAKPDLLGNRLLASPNNRGEKQ